MLSEKELLNILDNKEKVNVEFKEAKRGVPKSIYETYSSFANTNGGLIILGVKEIKTGTAVNYEISGVENANSIISDFWNTINSGKVNRNILKDADVYSLTVQGLELVILHIPRALYNQKPIYIGSNPYAGTFKRNFEGDYRCTKESVNSMIRDSFQNAGDNEILEWLNIGDLDKNTIAVYRTRFRNNNEGHIYEELSDKDFLTKMGAYHFDKKRNIEGVTSAGVLMFGKTETFNKIYHNVNLDYRDETNLFGDMRWSDRIIENGLWEKNLYNFITKVYPKLISEFPVPFQMKDSLQRNDETKLQVAAREALVNSVIHADFKEESRSILVIKKDNYISYSNPGLLRIPIEQIYQGGVSVPRNITLQKLFRFIGFGESAGSGYDKILAPSRAEGFQVPELYENQDMRITNLKLWIVKKEHGALSGALSGALEKPNHILNEKEQIVLNVIREFPNLNRKKIFEKTKIPLTSLDRYLDKLIALDLIQKKGSRKTVSYNVKNTDI